MPPGFFTLHVANAGLEKTLVHKVENRHAVKHVQSEPVFALSLHSLEISSPKWDVITWEG